LSTERTPQCLQGEGICAAIARAVDWSRTPLGPPAKWSRALQTIVSVILHSRHPMFLWWGESLTQLYNDAYVPSFGNGKHPAAMGQRGIDCWQEIWPIISPQIDDVMQRAKSSWNEDHLVPIFRNGGLEEVYWTYGYSPVFDDDGSVGGTLVVCTETTGRVVAERRLELIRALAISVARADEIEDVTQLAAQALARDDRDVPFVAFYDENKPTTTIGIDPEIAESIPADRPGLLTLAQPLLVGPWPERVTRAFVVRLNASGTESVVFGLSSRLPFDPAYQRFLEQITEQIVSERARARIESERRNLLLQAPVAAALLIGPDHVFEIANPLFRTMIGGRELVGKRYADAFPELREDPIVDILDRAYELGESFQSDELLIPIARRPGEATEDRFFKFNLEPIRNEEGSVYGMMAIAVDITEQVRARRAAEQMFREREQLLVDARAASRAKDEFLAMLGHELRNPLAPILTALQLMKQKGGSDLTRERDIIERQASHLVRLVDDLLDVARVVEGKIELRRARVALADVVARAVETATPLYEQKAHALHVEVTSEPLHVDGDPVRLSQVIANLLTNAAKYTDRGGEISLCLSRVDEEALIRVEDNGAGIGEEQLPHLFERFFQGPRRADRSEGGLGLGLALVKSLVALHGGSVTAASDGPGRGSAFEVRLPLLSHDEVVASERAARETPTLASAAMRVLLVDDNSDISEVFAAFLATFGFDVRTAHDGPTALDVADAFRPSVAVLDIGLPVMDGYELAARMRERLGGGAPRLIAMTGYGQPQDRASTREAGFEAHLVKPVDAYALIAAINSPTR